MFKYIRTQPTHIKPNSAIKRPRLSQSILWSWNYVGEIPKQRLTEGLKIKRYKGVASEYQPKQSWFSNIHYQTKENLENLATNENNDNNVSPLNKCWNT